MESNGRPVPVFMQGNGGLRIAGSSGVPANIDCEAYDQLPPLCRAAIRNAIIPWSAKKMLDKFAERGRSLKKTDDDRFMADELARIDREVAASTRFLGLTRSQKQRLAESFRHASLRIRHPARPSRTGQARPAVLAGVGAGARDLGGGAAPPS